MSHFMIALILYIHVLNRSWIKKKMSIFEEFVAFKSFGRPCFTSSTVDSRYLELAYLE